MEDDIRTGKVKAVVEVEYLGYTSSTPVTWYEGVTAHYRLIECFFGRKLPALFDVRYSLIKDSSACYPATDWKFSHKLLPSVGQHNILFLDCPPGGNSYIWWNADVPGELTATRANVEAVRSFCRSGLKTDLDLPRKKR